MRWYRLCVLSVLGEGCLSESGERSDVVVANPDALHDADVAKGPSLLKLAWKAHADQASTFFGEAVSSAGDVNGDGYADVLVGAPWDSHGENFEGRVFLYLGSGSGLEREAAWTAEPDQRMAHLGDAVASAGDVNADGYDDVIVGASRYEDETEAEGAAFLFLGSAAGLDLVPAWSADPTDLFQANYGGAVSSAGDVNGDGFDDVVVGASGFGNLEVSEGAALVYHGSASGLETTPAWKAQSNHTSSNLGFSVSSAGDVNGDGFGDVVVGAHGWDNPEIDEGGAFVFLGSALGLEKRPVWKVESDEVLFYFGVSVAGAGDTNGDGFDDVLVGWGGFGDELDKGRASLYFGSASGVETTAAWSVESQEAGSSFGALVSSAGDIDADGYADLLVGAPDTSHGDRFEGRVHVFLGSAAGPAPVAAWTWESNDSNGHLGTGGAAAGDVDGDGFGDIVVGAPSVLLVDDPPSPGTAYLFRGCGDVLDSDGDTIGDRCDACAGFDDRIDTDRDGVAQDCDLCPTVADARQEDSDGDGLGDSCAPLVLAVDEVSVSGGLSVVVDDARPLETLTVFFSGGPSSPGPCQPRHAGLCLDLGDGHQTTEAWDVKADDTGRAVLEAPLPEGAPEGTIVTVQAAAERRGAVKSNPVELVVTP